MDMSFFFNDTATTEIYTLSLHDALPICSDFFKADLHDADVIFCYLFPGAMDRFFREKFPELRPGTKIISHGFPILELEPVKKVEVGRAKIWVYEK